MKILWLARTCPYPPNDGEKLRVFNLLRILVRHHELTLVCRVMSDDEYDGLNVLREMGIQTVGVPVPSPTSYIQRLHWLLPFVFSRYPVSLCTVFFPKIRDAIRDLVSKQGFDVIQVEHSSLTIYLDYIRFLNAPALVLTMHNIDRLRNERIIAATPFGLRKIYLLWDQARFKQWEMASLQRYNRVVVMSALDASLLHKDLPDLAIDVVPNGVDCTSLGYEPPRHDENLMIFVASMDSEANHDGAMFFLREIFPLIRRYTNTRASMVGRNPQPDLIAMQNGSTILVTGKVDDVLPFYRQAAVAVVPLRSGGGTRLKILEAMAMGTPVVSTTVGAEGLEVSNEQNILLADTPTAFAQAVIRIIHDSSLAARLSSNARKLVENYYDWKEIAQLQGDVYQMAVNRVED